MQSTPHKYKRQNGKKLPKNENSRKPPQITIVPKPRESTTFAFRLRFHFGKVEKQAKLAASIQFSTAAYCMPKNECDIHAKTYQNTYIVYGRVKMNCP